LEPAQSQRTHKVSYVALRFYTRSISGRQIGLQVISKGFPAQSVNCIWA